VACRNINRKDKATAINAKTAPIHLPISWMVWPCQIGSSETVPRQSVISPVQKLANGRRTNFILQSRVALFKHCYQASSANSAMESVSMVGGFVGIRTVEGSAPA
jgi:hypothetical protein